LASAIGFLILAIGLVAGGRISATFFPSTESQIIYTNVSFTAGTSTIGVRGTYISISVCPDEGCD
jgi:hypothetical protein